MAYVAPTPVSDGNALSAANLNALSNAVEFLNGVATGPQLALNLRTSPSSTSIYYIFQYLHQYLHVRYYIEGNGGTADSVKIYLDQTGSGSWVEIITDGSPTSDANQNIVTDLTFVGADTFFHSFLVGTDSTGGDQTGTTTGGSVLSLTVGDFYEVRVDYVKNTDDGIRVPWVINADSTSL